MSWLVLRPEKESTATSDGRSRETEGQKRDSRWRNEKGPVSTNVQGRWARDFP